MTVQLLEPPQGLTAGTTHGFVRGSTMHALFQDVARRLPEARAVSHRGRSVSYSELDAASDGYAALLEAEGVGPGHLVPLVVPRGIQLIALLLAVLKRGAGYAVLDAEWPQDLLSSRMLALDAPLVVTAMPGPWPVPAWAPPTEDLTMTAVRGLRPTPVAVAADAPCSVFFTSGTSGTPKGVVATHQNAVRLFDGPTFAELGPGTVMPQTAPPTWDGFSLDCWSMLLTGGTTVLLDEHVLVPRTLRALIEQDGVNAAFMTTQLFNMLVNTDVGAFSGMKWVAIGGERVSPMHLRRFLAEHPSVRVLNVYGPVECGVIVTSYDITAKDCDDPAGIPLGHALPHTDVLVLDGTRQCVPGEIGELHLGGPGLAQGYLGRPELTASAFIEAEVDGELRRLYRTGDLGHRSAEGVLYYVGRNDRQIKIRGHRIEPAEVERTVERIAGVTGSAVVPMQRPDGSYHGLFLFYTANPENPASPAAPEELRERLAELLPAYMVPRRAQLLDRFPLLGNGKLDRRELAGRVLRHQGQDATPAGHDAGLTGTARTVAEAFRTVLRLKQVPQDESFFHLGGSSLDAAHLCVRLDALLGTAVQPSQVFRTPTVRGLADWLDAQVSAPAVPSAPVVPPAGEGAAAGDIPLLSHQSGFLWADAHDASGIGSLCRMTWWIDGDLDLDALALAATDVHLRHQALHARYGFRDLSAVATMPEDPGTAEFLRLDDADDEGSALSAWQAAVFRPLDVGNGLIWRCAAVRSAGTGRTLFGLVVHHAAFDGSSETVMASDLTVAYAARRAGLAPRFPTRAVGLSELATDYHRSLSGVDLTEQHSYWEERLEDVEPLLIPGRSENYDSTGPKYAAARTLHTAELAAWDDRARTLGTTRFAVLAALFGLTLRDLTGQQDITVKTPIARRGSGLLANAVNSRVDLLYLRFWPPEHEESERASGRDPLASAAASVDGALAAQDTNGATLYHILVWAGGGESLPLMPSFLMQDDPDPQLELPGCTVDLVRLDSPTMSTELELDVRITEGGALVTATVRTDRLPARVADAVVTAFTEAVRKRPQP